MKKSAIIVAIVFMMIGFAAYNATVNIYGLGKISENISDFKVYLDNLKVNDIESTGINDAKDEFTLSNIDGNISIDIVNDSTEYDTESYLECENNIVLDKPEWTFDYTGSEQTFTAPMSGTYKLETWGAQGGYAQTSEALGGYGGYSKGVVTLNKNDILYIIVGGKGTDGDDYSTVKIYDGGYNGGGNAKSDGGTVWGAGGGATSIQNLLIDDGQLKNYSNNIENVLIVSGGGGGAGWHYKKYLTTPQSPYNPHSGGSGGGYLGSNGITEKDSLATGGSQSKYGTNGSTALTISNGGFGYGGNYEKTQSASGGGSGLYGGGGAYYNGSSGAGGSGYIGNTLLTEKSMYCYNCAESSEESTKTISTTCISETPTENCAKSGNGYARIAYISSNFSTQKEIIEAMDSKSIQLKNISSTSLTCRLKVSKISRATKGEEYSGIKEWTFDYTGDKQEFIAPVMGTYRLETWGAQGYTINSYIGGYGGYSTGKIILSKNQKVYLFVGEKGKGGIGSGTKYSSYPNSLNAAAGDNVSYTGSGGGSTHIALEDSLISKITNLNKIIIVSGGGGASTWTSGNSWAGSGGSGGGFKGNSGKSNIAKYTPGGGGTQNSGGSAGNVGTAGNFGLSEATSLYETVGGGGYYGGGTSWGSAGGGGSGYIGNSNLFEKSMYCYNCTESTEESTKTISTTCASETPAENCAKSGNGYARITLIK